MAGLLLLLNFAVNHNASHTLSVCVSFFMSRFLSETPRSLMFTSLSFMKVGKL